MVGLGGCCGTVAEESLELELHQTAFSGIITNSVSKQPSLFPLPARQLHKVTGSNLGDDSKAR